MRLPRWKRKHGLALLGLAILTPPIAFGISNLFLVSPKGRAFIAAKIAERLPFETSVGGATWSPWNGITVYGIRLEQPGALRDAIPRPMLTVESVTIHPHWWELRSKRLAIKGVDIMKPELHVAIELLSQIPHIEEPALASKPPELAAATPAPAGGPTAEAMATQATANPPSPVINAPGGGKPPLATTSAPKVLAPNVWINVRSGRLGIVSMMASSPLLEVEGIDGSVPISGKPAKSNITISRIKGLGEQAPGKIELPLEWTAPMLGTGVIRGEMFGLDFNFAGHMGLVQGIPFRIDASVPEQKDREIRIGGKTLASIGMLASQGRTQGYLKAPATWQGHWIAQAAVVDVEIEGRRNRFDHGRALVIFRNGALRCLDARLTSEGATIIGNGMILSDGRMASNTRVVAAPETLASISRFIRPDQGEVNFTPLSTPQRAALDLQVFGYPGNLHYKPDRMADPIPLQ